MVLWIDDPLIIFDIDRLKYYIPGPHLTWEEQANSLVRFFIYLSLILYLYYMNPMALIIPPLLMMGAQYYYHQRGQLSQMMIYLFQGQLESPGEKTFVPEGDNFANDIPSANREKKEKDIKEGFEQPLNIKNPYLDDAKRYMDERLNDPTRYEELEPIDEIRVDAGLSLEPSFHPVAVECKVPTLDNPFGNAMPFDPIEKQVNRVCPDEFQKDQKFYGKLFNNVDDLFDRNNSQREFTTNPSSTRINDREAFMQFAYNTPYTEH